MTFRVVDWFYVQNGKKIGPVPVAEFDELVRSGRITHETLVWREGFVNWQPLGLINVPRSSPMQVPPPAVPRPMLPTASTVCAECGIAFPELEMIPFAGSWICAKCKPTFFQRVREGAPLVASGTDAWQSGDAVVTLHGATLPARCARCNGAATGKPVSRTLYWQPRWVYLSLLVPPVYIVLHLVLRRRVTVSVPICEEHRQRRQKFIVFRCFLLAIAIGAVMVAIFYGLEGIPGLALFILVAALSIGDPYVTLVSTKYIGTQYVWIRGFCHDYRAALPEFPDVE